MEIRQKFMLKRCVSLSCPFYIFCKHPCLSGILKKIFLLKEQGKVQWRSSELSLSYTKNILKTSFYWWWLLHSKMVKNISVALFIMPKHCCQCWFVKKVIKPISYLSLFLQTSHTKGQSILDGLIYSQWARSICCLIPSNDLEVLAFPS